MTLVTNFSSDERAVSRDNQSKDDSASPRNSKDVAPELESPDTNVLEESHAVPPGTQPDETIESNSPSSCEPNVPSPYSPLRGKSLLNEFKKAAGGMEDGQDPPNNKRGTRNPSGPLEKASPMAASELETGQKTENPNRGSSIRDILQTCKNALATSYNAFTLPKAGDGSAFEKNAMALRTFLWDVIKSNGACGNKAGEPASLCLCGAPGVGKTLSVTWAISEVRKWIDKQADFAPIFCFVNASHLSSSSQIYNKMSNALSLGKRQCTLKNLKSVLCTSKRSKRSFKWTCLVMVIDEVDLLLSERNVSDPKPSSDGERVLKSLSDLSSDKNFRLALIGISNSVGNKNVRKLEHFGLVRSHCPKCEHPNVKTLLTLTPFSPFSPII